jgi:hypothetical protein
MIPRKKIILNISLEGCRWRHLKEHIHNNKIKGSLGNIPQKLRKKTCYIERDFGDAT